MNSILWCVCTTFSPSIHPVWRPTNGDEVSLLPSSPHHLMLAVLGALDILTKGRWSLRVVLIIISLISKDSEYFIYFLANFFSSFENSLLEPSAHFSNGSSFLSPFLLFSYLFLLLALWFLGSLYAADTDPRQLCSWRRPSPSAPSSSPSWMFLQLFKVLLLDRWFSFMGKRVLFRKPFPMCRSNRSVCMFLSNPFSLSSFTFRSLIIWSLLLCKVINTGLISFSCQ